MSHYFESRLNTILEAHGQSVHVRWMIRKDMPGVMRVAAESGLNVAVEGLEKILQQRNYIGHVATIPYGPEIEVSESDPDYDHDFPAEQDDLIIGWMIYSLHKDYLGLDYLAPGENGEAGGPLIEKIKTKLSPERRSTVIYNTDYDDLDNIKLLSQHGFMPIQRSGQIVLVFPPSGMSMRAANKHLDDQEAKEQLEPEEPQWQPEPQAERDWDSGWDPDDAGQGGLMEPEG